MGRKKVEGEPKGKPPAFQFYVGDWKKDPELRSCSLEARGLWLELMLIMYENHEHRGYLERTGGGQYTEAQLCRIIGTDVETYRRGWTELVEAQVPSFEGGIVFCRKIVRDEHIRQVRSAAGKLGGNPNIVRRESGPLLLKQKLKQKPTPSSASSIEAAAVFPLSLEYVVQRFGFGNEAFLGKIAAAAEAVAGKVTDSELAAALVATDKRRRQDGTGLWLSTIPEYFSARKASPALPTVCQTCLGEGKGIRKQWLAAGAQEFMKALETADESEIYEACADCRSGSMERKPPGREDQQMIIGEANG